MRIYSVTYRRLRPVGSRLLAQHVILDGVLHRFVHRLLQARRVQPALARESLGKPTRDIQEVVQDLYGVDGSANPENIRNWARWIAQPLDQELLRDVQAIFAPVHNIGHVEGLPENN